MAESFANESFSRSMSWGMYFVSFLSRRSTEETERIQDVGERVSKRRSSSRRWTSFRTDRSCLALTVRPRAGITSDALSLDHARLARNLNELCCKLLVSEGEGTGNVGCNAHLVVRQGGVDSEVDLQPHAPSSAPRAKTDRGGITRDARRKGSSMGPGAAGSAAFASHRVCAFTAIEVLDESIAAVHGVAGGEPGSGKRSC